MTIAELQMLAHKLGFASRVSVVDRSRTGIGSLPAIIPLDKEPLGEKGNHFVVIYGGSSEGALLIDHPYPGAPVNFDRLRDAWDGTALFIARNEGELNAVLGPRSWDWLVPGVGILVAIAAMSIVYWPARRPPLTKGPV